LTILHSGFLSRETRRRDNKHKTSASILKEILAVYEGNLKEISIFLKEILVQIRTAGKFVVAVQRNCWRRCILQKFKNL
jgi:hypothetical protein